MPDRLHRRAPFSWLLLCLFLLVEPGIARAAQPTVDLQPLDCTREPWVRSLEDKIPSSIQFANPTSQVRKVFWLDGDGKRQPYVTLPPGSKTGVGMTFATDAYAATDSSGQCLAVYIAADQPGRVVLPAQAVPPVEPSGSFIDLPPLDHTREPWVRSLSPQIPTSIQFVNPTSQPRQIFWVGLDGKRHPRTVLQPGQTMTVGGPYGGLIWTTDVYGAADSSGQCLALFVPTDKPGRATLPDAPIEPAGERAMTDRPDDSSGYQIHVVYAVPSDGADEKLDVNGAIATSIAAGQNWFAGQTGGRTLRIDTYHGALDISFFRLSWSDGFVRSLGSGEADAIRAELLAAGFDRSNKIYAIYYGGGAGGSECGRGGPDTGGVIFLHGIPGGSQAPCDYQGLASSATNPGFLDYALFHEIFHSLGFVPPCAPHHTEDSLVSHVDDDPRDIMYTGSLPTNWSPPILDSDMTITSRRTSRAVSISRRAPSWSRRLREPRFRQDGPYQSGSSWSRKAATKRHPCGRRSSTHPSRSSSSISPPPRCRSTGWTVAGSGSPIRACRREAYLGSA